MNTDVTTGRPLERGVQALEAVGEPVTRLLGEYLAECVRRLEELDPALVPIGREVDGLVAAGGKRIRPAFVYWGHRATGAAPSDAVYAAAGAVELLHTFALIHDDVMDRSPERRGRPAVHEALAAQHRREGLRGDAAWFGLGGAILAGDLAFVWSDELFDTADLPPDVQRRARRVFTELRMEVMAGQYLDLRLAGDSAASEQDALHVALLKSGRYTVTRPLQLGVAIGGGDAALEAALREYGDALGVAFQLRDDVLGLFGDPEEMGKGAISDLREGKRTVLMLRTLQRATPAQREVLLAALGNPEADADDAARVREIVVDSGALAEIEALLEERRRRAQEALPPLPPAARDALEGLAELAVARAV
ncbi:MAG TPA: polyprenyl synthetase family protein [Egibacteraceae bacterium]